MHAKLVAPYAVITALLSEGRELKLTEYWIKTLATKIFPSSPFPLSCWTNSYFSRTVPMGFSEDFHESRRDCIKNLLFFLRRRN